MNRNLFIIIPIHDRKNFTSDCLSCLKKQTVTSFQTLIIDDGSTDGSAEEIKNEFPDVTILHGDGNLWWTGATNLGIRYALEHHADYVLTLNNDTLPDTNFIEKMLYWAEQKPDGLLGALAVDSNSGKIVYAGETINWKTGRYQPLLDNPDAEELSGIHEVTHFPGRGLLIPAKVITKIGLFDQEHFVHYAADYDFTHRAIRGGFKVYCNYDARLKTFPEASGGQEIRKNRTLKNYWTHLFGVKGVGNLKIFWFYAIRNCPRKYLPFFLIDGLTRRIIGYWLNI